MTWRDLTVEKFNTIKKKTIIDVRSPCEYEKEYIPGAINVPLLSDEQRAQVGTVYKQEGELRARRMAVEIISPKIPALVDEIAERRDKRAMLVVHCWRGGLRSEAVAGFLSVVGIDCWRLVGGYKAWRRAVLADFESDNFSFDLVVVDGLTGVGKTQVLDSLRRLDQRVCDLEGLANHRGSVFGGIGLEEQPSQKNFEGALWCQLAGLDGELLFVEAESRKVGRLAVPTFLLKRMQTAPRVLVEGTLAARCRRLVKCYGEGLEIERIRELLLTTRSIRERIGNERLRELEELLQAGNLDEFTRALLSGYYDPLYLRHIKSQKYDLVVRNDDPERVAAEIVARLDEAGQLRIRSEKPEYCN